MGAGASGQQGFGPQPAGGTADAKGQDRIGGEGVKVRAGLFRLLFGEAQTGFGEAPTVIVVGEEGSVVEPRTQFGQLRGFGGERDLRKQA